MICMTSNSKSPDDPLIGRCAFLEAKLMRLEEVNEEQDHTIATLIFERNEARAEAAHLRGLLGGEK